MDIPWDDVRLLLAISESGSLSGAARRLAIGQPTVSRRLAELESALGYGLFRRTAGGAALTNEDGSGCSSPRGGWPSGR